MDKAIIIGVYEYLGFHLCLKFLEAGSRSDRCGYRNG